MQMQPLPDDLPPGTDVGGYAITHKIGQGGMGQVYMATHPVIGKRVAIKTLSPNRLESADHVSRFIEEARAACRIQHPHIVDVFSFGQLPDGRHYIVMEYLEGETLAERLRREPLSASHLRRALRQICAGLEAAHRAGIVHRDLKPANIWLAQKDDGDIDVKLLDFGVAKLLGSDQRRITRTGITVGTPSFMSPEQCLGRLVDHRADLYSFGIILYLVFTGVMPFSGQTLADLVYRHTMEPPLPPSRQRDMPQALEQIILDCLEKDPALRPPSARVLGQRLEGALIGTGITSALPSRKGAAGVTRLIVPAGRATQAEPARAVASAPTPTEDLGATATPGPNLVEPPSDPAADTAEDVRATGRRATRVAGAAGVLLGLAALGAAAALFGGKHVRAEDVDAAATVAGGRLRDAVAAEAHGFEGKAKDAAASSWLLHAIDISEGDRNTLQNAFDDEDWWAPFRAPSLVSALIAGKEVLAATGPSLGALGGSDLITRARAAGVAAGVVAAADRAFAAAAIRVTGYEKALLEEPVVVIGAPLDKTVLVRFAQLVGGAVGLVELGGAPRILTAAGPEQDRQALMAMVAMRPAPGRGVMVKDGWGGTIVPLADQVGLAGLFPAPASQRDSGFAAILAAAGFCILMASVFVLVRARGRASRLQ